MTANCHDGTIIQEGLAVASIARDVVVEMTLPATTMWGKFGLEFET